MARRVKADPCQGCGINSIAIKWDDCHACACRAMARVAKLERLIVAAFEGEFHETIMMARGNLAAEARRIAKRKGAK